MRSPPFAALALLLLGAPAWAADLTVVTSHGFEEAIKAAVPVYEKQSGNHVTIQVGPSMGQTPMAVPQRMARGEAIDVLTMVGYALDDLVKAGKATDEQTIALSKMGAVVKQGAPVPDVSSVEKLRQALLGAKVIAISDSASGVYIQKQMLKKLGIEEQVRGKVRVVPADPVAGVVAKGEADIGFQQISELKPIGGVTLLGPLPDEVQDVTVYAAGVVASSHDQAAARSLVAFLRSPAAAPAITESGMEPPKP